MPELIESTYQHLMCHFMTFPGDSKNCIFLLSLVHCFLILYSFLSTSTATVLLFSPSFNLSAAECVFLSAPPVSLTLFFALLHLHSSTTFSTHSCITYLCVQKFLVKCPLSLAHRKRCAEYKLH